MDNEQLTPDEIKVLKEFTANLMATGRVGRFVRSALIWLASGIGAGWVVWEFFKLGKQ